MKKSEFKQYFYALLGETIDGISYEEKLCYAEGLLHKFQCEKENAAKRDCSNKGNPWKDEELAMILLAAPTKQNCLRFAKIFKRGYGSIEQIYRWAATSSSEINAQREDDSFMKQIKRVAREVGFIA